MIQKQNNKNAMPIYCAEPSGDEGLTPWTKQVRTMILERWPVSSIGGFRAGDPMDHGKGLVLDVMIGNDKNWEMRSLDGRLIASEN